MASASAPTASGSARHFHLPLTSALYACDRVAVREGRAGDHCGRMNEHPNYVFIPDSRTEGVRAYREPDVPHPLQLAFLEEVGERAYVEHLRSLLSAARLDEADAILTADIAGFGGKLARLCQAATREAVTVEGWDDLLPILAEYEGPPITALTVGMTNDSDLVFEAGAEHEPALVIGLYSDDSYDFSGHDASAVLAECLSESPAFAGADEDVEFYAVSAGLAPLNTALIQSKHRYFLRDGRDGVEGRAPGGYVEYVLATWLRALRFLQALDAAANQHGIPNGARLIAGTVGLGTDLACLLGQGEAPPQAAPAAAPVAALTMKKWEARHDPLAEPVDEAAACGNALRRKLNEAAEPPPVPTAPDIVAPAVPAPEPKLGFFARLFARRRRSQS